MKVKVNRHASTLVIVCIVKMLDILLAICENAIITGEKISSKLIRRIYITCAKMYVGDMVLYNAMLAIENDIFYQSADSEAW